MDFIVKDGLGLNNPVIKVSNGDEIVVTGMSYKDKGDNIQSLEITDEMEKHYTEDFELTGVGGKKYNVTREVTIYKPEAKVKGGRFKSKIISVQGVSKDMNEEHVADYKGYSIYRVPDAENDDFEIWKKGKKVMSCETSAEAEEWINDQEIEISDSTLAILNGVPVREAILNFKSRSKGSGNSNINSLCKSLSANDIYTCSSEFKSLVGELINHYSEIGDSEIDLEFAVDKNDIDSSGVSLKITTMPNGVDCVEVSKLNDGVMTTVKRTYHTKYQEVMDIFKKLILDAERNETDEDKIEMSISFAGQEFTYEMDNPSFNPLPKAANESMLFRDNLGVTLKEDDQEYWDYVHTYGSQEEKEKAADYFDVTPSAFEETYAQFYDLDEYDESKTFIDKVIKEKEGIFNE